MCQRRTKQRLQVTCTDTKSFAKFGHVVFEICERTDIHEERQTHRRAHRKTRTPTGVKRLLAAICWCSVASFFCDTDSVELVAVSWLMSSDACRTSASAARRAFSLISACTRTSCSSVVSIDDFRSISASSSRRLFLPYTTPTHNIRRRMSFPVHSLSRKHDSTYFGTGLNPSNPSNFM